MMSKERAIDVVSGFNRCITEHDLDTLNSLMTENNRFVDASDDVVEGRKEIVEAWHDFFLRYPDYVNVFQTVEYRDGLVIMSGQSTCSEKGLDAPHMDGSSHGGFRIRMACLCRYRSKPEKAQDRFEPVMRQFQAPMICHTTTINYWFSVSYPVFVVCVGRIRSGPFWRVIEDFFDFLNGVVRELQV